LRTFLPPFALCYPVGGSLEHRQRHRDAPDLCFELLHRFGRRRDPLHRGRGERRRRAEADAEGAEDNERRCRVQYEAALVGEAWKAVTDATQADAAVGPCGPGPSPRGGERHAPWDALLLQPAHGRAEHQCQEHRDHHRQHDGPAKPERGDDHQRDDDD